MSKTTWICSACGSSNSLTHDNVCWRCLEKALAEDEKKLRDLGAFETDETMRKAQER